jgi:DNA mismatch endonuclease (patch repair protein)
MPDIFTKRKHSAVMSAIRACGNAATELRLIALFRSYRFARWRRDATIRGAAVDKNEKSFRVKPDFFFRTHRLAVFVDGCPLRVTQPRQNAKFWRVKLARN